MNFILIEYVTLPAFKIWKQADFKSMITSNQELRNQKIRERTFKKRGEDEFALLREKAFDRFIEKVNDANVIIKNEYNNLFEKNLKELYKKIISM